MPAARILHVAINNKIATYNRRDGEIVCNNPEGYAIQFAFDSEWAGVENKIARFIWNGEYFDQEIKGDTCPVPDLHDTDSLMVGVFVEGGLRTTTDAVIPCRRSILCKSAKPNKNTGKGYTTQAQEAAKEAESAADRAEDAAARAEAASDALNTPGTIYATDDGEGNVTLRGDAVEMVDQEARAGVAELRSQLANLDVSVEIPAFDLVDLGLPVVALNGEAATLETDTTEIMAALGGGSARFRVQIEHQGITFDVVPTMQGVSTQTGAGYLCGYTFDALGGLPLLLNLTITEGSISATCLTLATGNGEEGEEPAAAELPTFDLVTLGLPAVPMDGTQVVAQMDTTDIRTALDKGAVKFIASFLFGTSAVAAEVVMNKVSASALGMYICSYAFDFDGLPMIFNLYVAEEGAVVAFYTNLAKTETPATSIDLSALDSAGQIVETFADGTSKTTTLEFDEGGNPVKITDGDGNVTTLTW